MSLNGLDVLLAVPMSYAVVPPLDGISLEPLGVPHESGEQPVHREDEGHDGVGVVGSSAAEREGELQGGRLRSGPQVW